MQALDDILILDLTRILAGPYCTMLLADYGAQVIKVEQPGSGDGTRQWGPPWVGDQSAYFLSINRNKHSLTLNLKTPEGQGLLQRLAAQADVLIENFKPGTLARFGLDEARLKADYPQLIVCSITGFGQSGPYRDRAGYDAMIQAQGGIMSITGEVDGEPSKVGVAIADITTGLYAATAVLAALHHRSRTGEGQQIDVALFDAQVGWLANVAHNFFATGETPARYGNAHPSIVPYQTFPTADGHLMLAVGSDGQFQKLCQLLERPDLGEDVRFTTNASRVTHREALITALRHTFQAQPTAVWLAGLDAAGIPAGPINTVAQTLQDPHVQARGMVQTVEHPTLGPIDQLGPVAKLSATPATIRSAPPLLGADSDAILQHRLGLSPEEITALRHNGVI